ncbi:MAG: SOS response-associated peptidase, partial [Pseudomonadota bacterium]
MCGRFDDHLPKMHGWSDLLGEWSQDMLGVTPSYNVSPTATIAAFSCDQGQVGEPLAMRWGMIPSWSKSFESKYATFNARIETAASKPTFRTAWREQRRCLIPMAGYYEWQQTQDGKQPFYITDKNAGILVAAGLFEPWSDQ